VSAECQCDILVESTQGHLKNFVEICKKESMSLRLETAIKELVVKLLARDKDEKATSSVTHTDRSASSVAASAVSRVRAEFRSTLSPISLQRSVLTELNPNHS
jgi:hypothetical protein